MYGKAQTTPCPMCTMWIDGFNGVAHHVAQNADFVVVAAADLPALRAHGRDRVGSAAPAELRRNTFKYDLRSEDDDGSQDSTVSVFDRDGALGPPHVHGAPDRPTTSASAASTLCATWHLLDLTPHGRGDWYSQLSTNRGASGSPVGGSLHDDRVQRRAARADDRHRRGDEEAFRHAVGGAVGRELVEVEQLADEQPEVAQRGDVPREELVARLGRHDRARGGVGRDHRDVVIVQPRNRARRDAGLAAVGRFG